MAQGDTITITDNGDGTWSVEIDDQDADQQGAPSGPDDAAENGNTATAHSPAEVLQNVKAELEENGQDGASMWKQEAAKRGASGMPAPGGGGPAMSM